MSKKTLTLSIVIPVYNEEHHIRGCLESIAAQIVPPDEVIVVDNNSTDGTVAIAQEFAFVRLVTEKKQSVLYARTTGFNAAKSALIGRIDADTVLPPDWVERAKSLMTDPSLSAITGPDAIYDTPFPSFTRRLHDALLRIAVRGGYHFLTGSNMVIRRSAWEAVKDDLCDDLRLFEDTDLALHLTRRGMIPTYNSQLWASVSGRRFADKIPDFFRYARRHRYTLAHHNVRVIGVYYAQAAYTIAYFLYKPIQRFYDPRARRFTLKYLYHPLDRRADPMDGYVRKVRERD